MPSLHFKFVINPSLFLGESGHPITVPRGEVDYKLLEAARLHQGNFTFVFPRGERVTAKMYHGDAGYGPYYQLKFTGGNRDIPSYVEAGKHVFVLLARMANRNYAILEEVAP